MKIGLDIHGVIDALPEVFTFLADSIIKNGGEVHIITGGSIDDKIRQKLSEIGIPYTHLVSIYDFLIENDYPTNGTYTFPDGTMQKQFCDKDWDSAKANYCTKHSIDLHIDDTLIYNEYFETPFARLWTHNNKPKSSTKDVRHLD